jgi:hypothetical protein
VNEYERALETLRRSPPHAVHMLRRWIDGESLRKIGDDVGLSHERVRMIILEHFPDAKAWKKSVSNNRENARDEQRLARLTAQAKPCRVCGKPNLRGVTGDYITCSHECARTWVEGGRCYLDPEGYERHRLSLAKSILRHADRRRPSQVEWAKRYLADPEATPPDRRYMIRGRKPSQHAARLNGEPAKELVDDEPDYADLLDVLEASM